MKEKLSTLYAKDGTKKLISSLISILVGLLVGGIVVAIVGIFYSKISGAGIWDGIRLIFAGILNTIPGTVVAGKEYEHSYTLTLSGVSNKDNINIIVYIMDTYTGEVVNACTIKTRDIQGGVADMIVDTNDAPVEYFNLQGIRVANPAEGQIYIRRQGTQATKVLF